MILLKLKRSIPKLFNTTLFMQDFQKAIKNNNGSLIASYFTSYSQGSDNFTSLFPPIPINKIIKNIDTLKKISEHSTIVYDEFAPPNVNPEGDYFWTEPYFDRSGNGMMVSCAIPVYQQNFFAGIVGIDITLNFLNKFIEKSSSLNGSSFLVSPKNNIIIGTNIHYKNEKKLLQFNKFLNRLERKNNFISFQKQLNHAPWTFIRLIPTKTIIKQTFINISWFLILSIFAILIVLISYSLILKYFIKPAIIAEENLTQSNDDLKKVKVELESNILDLQNAQKKIIKAEKLASLATLVTGMAHEINTPAGVAITANSMICEKVFELQQAFDNNKISKSLFQKWLTQMNQSSYLVSVNLDRVAELIKDFKSVSSCNNEYQLSQFNFKDYLYKITSIHKNSYKNDAHKIRIYSDDITITTYKNIFDQIILTLIDNTIRHAFNNIKNGLIEITLRENDNNYELVYTDNGCGINTKAKSKIFDPFYSLDKSQGKGLGLFIIHNIIKETLHGDILITDTIDKTGVCFVITWPKIKKI